MKNNVTERCIYIYKCCILWNKLYWPDLRPLDLHVVNVIYYGMKKISSARQRPTFSLTIIIIDNYSDLQ